MIISGLHWRPAGWCCVELHFGTVLGDKVGPSSLRNSILKTNPLCNSTQHKIDNYQKSNEYAIFIYYSGFHKIVCVLATFLRQKDTLLMLSSKCGFSFQHALNMKAVSCHSQAALRLELEKTHV